MVLLSISITMPCCLTFSSYSTKEPPFYNPKLAVNCEGNDCTIINWGQQAHVPTPWDSPIMYYTRYRDCGNGVIQYDMAMYHFGVTQSTFTYFNTPWTGVRTSTFPQLMMSNTAGELEDKYPLNNFPSDRNGDQLVNLENMGGFTTFAESLQIPQYNFPFCVDSTNPSNWYYCDDTNAPATLERFSFEVKEANKARATGHWQTYGLAEGSTVKLRWCQLSSGMTQGNWGWGSPGRKVIITNENTGDAFESDYIIHYCWTDNYTYMSTNETASWINDKFPLGSSITVAYQDTSGLSRDQQSALTFVHGKGEEYYSSPSIYGRSRIRFGTTNANRDGTVFTTNLLGFLNNEQVYHSRKFLVTDLLSNMEATGQDLTDEAEEEVFSAGGRGTGEVIKLWTDATSFGASIGSEACPEAVLACEGNSAPSSTNPRPLFYITCGSNMIVSHDPYTDPYSGTVPIYENVIKRPYKCQLNENDAGRSGRAEWKLLGFFPDGACFPAIESQNKEYVSDYCEQRLATPSDIPSSRPLFSSSPSESPSTVPSSSPFPSLSPSETVTLSSVPSESPSTVPSASLVPSLSPTETVTLSTIPSENPSTVPSLSEFPTFSPSETVTLSPVPSESPSVPVGDTWEPFYSDDFESGQGIFKGNNKRFNVVSRPGGIWSLRLRKTSALKTSWIDTSAYSQVSISFWYYATNMEIGDSFRLRARFNGEQKYTIFEDWERGTDFNNKLWVEGTAIIDVPVGKTKIQLQFKGNSNQLNDRVYIDDVLFEGNLS